MSSRFTFTRNEFAREGAEQAMKAAIVQTAIAIEGQATALAPSDKGALRNSIMWEKGWSSDVFGFPNDGGFNTNGSTAQATSRINGANGLEAIVGTAIEYGVYQEFGTRFQKAQPFLRPAAERVRGVDAGTIARRWGKEAMEREFRNRRASRG